MTPRQAEYREYLKTEHWRLLRRAVIERDGRRCTRCPATKRLQAHHRFYRQNFEDSIPDDLTTLCRSCHEREHGLQPVAAQIHGVAGSVGKRRWDIHGNLLSKSGKPIRYGKKKMSRKQRKRARVMWNQRRSNWSF